MCKVEKQATSLFDAPVEQATPSFMDKINSVKKSYDDLLGVEFVQNIKILLKEYEEVQEYHESMNNMVAKQKAKIEEFQQFKEFSKYGASHFKDHLIGNISGSSHNYDYDLSAKQRVTCGKLKARLNAVMLKSFNIDYEFGFVGPETSYESLIEEILEATNSGNFEEVANEQLMESIRSNLIKHKEITLSKKKIVFNSFTNSYKCSIFKRYETNMDNKTLDALINSMAAHYKEVIGIEEGADEFLFFNFLTNHLSGSNEESGVYKAVTEVVTDYISKARLFKNGKLELEFKTTDIASSYYTNYILANKGE